MLFNFNIQHGDVSGVYTKVIVYVEFAQMIAIQYEFDPDLTRKSALRCRIRQKCDLSLFKIARILNRGGYKTVDLFP